MNVMLVIRSYHPTLAGAEIAFYRTADALARHGLRVTVHSVGGPAAAPPELGPRVSYVATEPQVPLAASRDVDVIHLVDAVDADTALRALELARQIHARLVFTPMTDRHLWADTQRIADVLATSDAVCAYSDAEAQVLAALGADRLVRLTQGAALAPAFDGKRFRQAHHVPMDAPMILFLGRKMRSKGYVRLLESLPLIWTERPDVVAAFLGPRTDAQSRQVFADCRDARVIEMDVVDEQTKTDALAAANVMCLPSTVDVFPLAVIEAWAMSVPVVCGRFADAGAVQEGVDGLVAENEPASLAPGLLAVLGDHALSARLSAAGRARYEAHHHWGAIARRLVDLYGDLVAGSSEEGSVGRCAPS